VEQSASDGGREPLATTQVAHAALAAEQTVRDQLTPWYEAIASRFVGSRLAVIETP
jgi:hypothetical protein